MVKRNFRNFFSFGVIFLFRSNFLAFVSLLSSVATVIFPLDGVIMESPVECNISEVGGLGQISSRSHANWLSSSATSKKEDVGRLALLNVEVHKLIQTKQHTTTISLTNCISRSVSPLKRIKTSNNLSELLAPRTFRSPVYSVHK